jgi:hypothetical protein
VYVEAAIGEEASLDRLFLSLVYSPAYLSAPDIIFKIRPERATAGEQAKYRHYNGTWNVCGIACPKHGNVMSIGLSVANGRSLLLRYSIGLRHHVDVATSC